MPAVAQVALQTLFWMAARTPGALRLLRPAAVWGAYLTAATVRNTCRENARGIFGADVVPARVRKYTRGVLGAFFDFVVDMGRFSKMDLAQMRAEIAKVLGEDRFLQIRSSGRGAIMVTAHMGSFEIGMAGLSDVEKTVHVVFKRDAFPEFERLRSAMRRQLGVSEAAIDDGWKTLIGLREALARNEVVVLQGDRAMPGQRSANVPFLSGRILLPTGPITLARLGESPIVPVFTMRLPDGRFCVALGEAIHVREHEEDEVALKQVAAAMEAMIAQNPEQWLVLHEAFVKDVRQ